MKRLKVIPILVLVMLLLAACGSEPGISVTLVPVETQKPSAAVSDSAQTSSPQASSPQAASPELYSGPYREDILPQSMPIINDADKKTFNAERTSAYLITSLDANHEYIINSAELRDGKLYLTVSDSVWFEVADDASNYLKEVFSLSNEDILRLPEFKDCYIENGAIWCDGNFRLEEKTLDCVPVADDAVIVLPNEFDADEVSVQDFINKFLKRKSINKNISDDIVSFECLGEQITAIYSAEDM